METSSGGSRDIDVSYDNVNNAFGTVLAKS